MSVALLARAAEALGPLLDEVVFVGGACLGLWLTDPSAPIPRPTKDVDIVIEVNSRLDYMQFSEKMRIQGFAEDSSSSVICRWRHIKADLLLDAMPTNPEILGFCNHWQGEALTHATQSRVPPDIMIRAASPPYLLATKLEAYTDRGRHDRLASRDFEDIVALIDGRAELPAEVRTAPHDVRAYISEQLVELLASPNFRSDLTAMLRPDGASQARIDTIVLPRLHEILRPTLSP